MKALVIGDIGIIFTYEFIVNILSKIDGVSIDVLSFAPRSEKNRLREEALEALGCNIFYRPRYAIITKLKILHPLLRFLEAKRYSLVKNYDLINIHFIGRDSWVVPHYAKKNARVVASIYGSDLLRANDSMLKTAQGILTRANAITVASTYVGDCLSKKFSGQFDGKVSVVKYGSDAARIMHECLNSLSADDCRREFGIPNDKTVVLCGYNASRSQRHLDIIRQLKGSPDDLKKRLFLLFQCTYGGERDYINEIDLALKKSGISGMIYTEYLLGEKLAKFRKCADIFLNLQPTDVLSASMIEQLEAGSIAVIGSWLSYPDLEGQDFYYLTVDSFDELAGTLNELEKNISDSVSRAGKNTGIWEILSWDKQYPAWRAVLTGECAD